MPLLHPGGTFPDLTLAIPGGETGQVPGVFAGNFRRLNPRRPHLHDD